MVCSLILFCGIPAVSKTTTIQEVIKKNKEHHHHHHHHHHHEQQQQQQQQQQLQRCDEEIDFIVLNFDRLFRRWIRSLSEQKAGFETNSGFNIDPAHIYKTEWKRIREIAFQITERLISNFCPCSSDPSSSPSSSSSFSEQSDSLERNFIDSAIEEILSSSSRAAKNDKKAIVLDDNFYFRSMRSEYFQLARRSEVCYLEIFLLSSKIENCLLRNRKRNDDLQKESSSANPVDHLLLNLSVIPDQVILDMAKKCEFPELDENARGRHIPQHRERSLSIDVEPMLGPDGSSSIADFLLPVIRESFDRPLVDTVRIAREMHEREVERNLASILHQADLSTRRAMGLAIKDALGGLRGRGPAEKNLEKNIGLELNELRKAFLEEIRSTKFLIDELSQKSGIRVADEEAQEDPAKKIQYLVARIEVVFQERCREKINGLFNKDK